jgi:hypothetical protein
LVTNHVRWRYFGGDPPILATVKGQARASDRHVADLVASLRRIGLLKATPAVTDRRTLLLEPSAELTEEIGRHPRIVADIYTSLSGAALPVPSKQDRTGWLIMRAAMLSDGNGLPTSPFTAVAAFSAHDSGYLLLLAVLQPYYATPLAARRALLRRSARMSNDKPMDSIAATWASFEQHVLAEDGAVPRNEMRRA